MPVIRNSSRAFVIALLPLALLHAALMANGAAGSTAAGGQFPAPDRALLVFALRLGIDGTLLWAGHLLLRSLRRHSRGAYGIMGGVAAAAGYTTAFYAQIWLASPAAGAIVTAAILPVVAGMLAGFLCAQFAGREVTPAVHAETAMPSPDHPSAPAVVATYDGPVQVRTSLAATAMAAAIPGLVLSIVAATIILSVIDGSDGPQSGPHSARAMQLALPAQMIISTLFAMFIPSAIVVGATHALARSLRRTRGWEYALIGTAMGAAGSLLLVFLVNAAFAVVLGAATGALMGAVYRRFAGIEPLALPEDVLSADPNALVAEDHPSRRRHAVILNG